MNGREKGAHLSQHTRNINHLRKEKGRGSSPGSHGGPHAALRIRGVMLKCAALSSRCAPVDAERLEQGNLHKHQNNAHPPPFSEPYSPRRPSVS